MSLAIALGVLALLQCANFEDAIQLDGHWEKAHFSYAVYLDDLYRDAKQREVRWARRELAIVTSHTCPGLARPSCIAPGINSTGCQGWLRPKLLCLLLLGCRSVAARSTHMCGRVLLHAC